MIVTPGYTFNSTETVTHTKLNQAANPTVELETGDVSVDLFTQADLIDLIGEGGSLPNYFRNGNFSGWTRGTTAISCPDNSATYRADWWFCLPENVASGSVLYSRETAASTTDPDVKSLYSAKLVGDTGIQIVDFGQDIGSTLAAALRTTVTLSFWLYNGTGASLTPSVRFDTADSIDNFSAVTNRGSVTTGTAVANGAWKLYEFTADVSAYSNITNGLRAMIRLPNGALSSGGKYVRIAQAKLERGAAASEFVVERDEVVDDTDATTETTAPRNFLNNPQFAYPRWVNLPELTAIASISGRDTYGPESWFVRAATGGATLSRAVLATADQPVAGLASAFLITGDAAQTETDVGQNIRAHAAGGPLQTSVTFSVYVYNSSGTAFTPSLIVETCDTLESFAATTNRLNQTLTPCPDGAWTRLEHNFSVPGLTNSANGFRLAVRLPIGVLDYNGKSVKLAHAQLELAASASTPVPVPDTTLPFLPVAQATDLVISNTDAGVIDPDVITATATELILRADDGSVLTIKNFSETVDRTASIGAGGIDTGVNTERWYYLWAIANGTGASMIYSTSTTRPTLPAGFRWFAKIGAAFHVSASGWRYFVQRGKLAFQKATAVHNAAVGDTAWHAFSTANFGTALPNGIVGFGGSAGVTTNVRFGMLMSPRAAADSPNTDVITFNMASSGTAMGIGTPAFYAAQTYWLPSGAGEDQAALVPSYRMDAAATLYVDVSQYELA